MAEPDKKKRRHEVNMVKCNALLDALWKQDAPMAMFQKPVSEAEAPGYFNVIDVPMDLSTMRSKLQTGRYKSNRDVIADARLMLTNALEFNARGDAWYRHAKALMKRLSATIDSCGLAKYDDDNGDSDDDVFIPQGRVVDKESRLAKDERKAQEDVPQLLQTLQDDLEIPIEELRKRYAAAAAPSASSAVVPANNNSDDDEDDHSSLTSDDEEDDDEESSADEEDDCTSSSESSEDEDDVGEIEGVDAKQQ
jgi:hypothetical protein